MDDAERAALRAKYERPALSLTLPCSPRLGLLIVCVAILLGLLFSLRMPLQRSDDFFKVIGAMGLATGRGYCDISRPDAPFLTKYPPLGPVMMAPFIGFVGEFLRPLRLLSFGCYLASLPLTYRLLVPRVGHRVTLALLLLAGFNTVTLRVLNFEGNIGLMVLLATGVVFVLERPVRHRWLVLGVLLGLFFYAHRIGIVLALGAVLQLGLVQRERQAALGTSVLVLALAFPWLWRSYQLTGHWVSPEYEGELAGRALQGAAHGVQGPLALMQHMLTELLAFPSSVGYGLFPWSRASGGQPWPFLSSLGLGWVATLGEWAITGLVLWGWGHALRSGRRFSDQYLVLHTLMLLAFFVGFQYFALFLPWLYLYLAQGAARLLPKRLLPLGVALLFVVVLAKDTKAFWLYPGGPRDRDLRWAWVAQVVPPAEAVYYPGLENYIFSQLRYFDSGRMAVGLSDTELETALTTPTSPVRWLCVGKQSPLVSRVQAAGWHPVFAEPDFTLPTATGELSAAQKSYLSRVEPPQVLWRR